MASDGKQMAMVGLGGALQQPGVVMLLAVAGGLLVVAGAVIAALSAAGVVKGALRGELIKRTVAWAVMAPIVVVPVLFGKLPTVVLVTLISLLCYREFARATGLFREKLMSALVVVGIVLFNFAALDHWYDMFLALAPLSVVVIAAAAILKDEPKGYIQRVGLACLSVLLFGGCLAHLSYLANDRDFRGPMLLLLLAVAVNDVFAFCVGKTIGGAKLAPNTSPGKTVSGAVGAVALTTITGAVLGSFVFTSELGTWRHLIVMAMLVSVAGILGDLTISSVKRDVGIKDMGVVIPGHGGVLDRCNSLLLAAPAIFHYIGYVRGVGLDQATRVITGG